MDNSENSSERDLEVDLENGGMICEDDSRKSTDSGVKKLAKSLLDEVYDRFTDASIKGDKENLVPCCNLPNSEYGVASENANLLVGKNSKFQGEKSYDGEKRKKSLSNKRPPKPPRPPRGPSLDAADQKLIREITELAMLKRARIERMRALKKMKAAKTSSSSGNIFATVFTILLCLVIIFQGMSPRAASGSFQGSPMSSGRTEGGLISVQYVGNPSESEPNGAYSGSPNLVERVSGFDTEEKLERVAW